MPSSNNKEGRKEKGNPSEKRRKREKSLPIPEEDDVSGLENYAVARCDEGGKRKDEGTGAYRQSSETIVGLRKEKRHWRREVN